jgi:hypothetical protein
MEIKIGLSNKLLGCRALLVYIIQCNDLRESSYIPDDGHAWSEYVIEFTWKAGLGDDSTSNLWRL